MAFNLSEGLPKEGAVVPYEDFTVAWICAIEDELTAARYMLDREYRLPYRKDNNVYAVGCIAGHLVAIACLPSDTGPGAALAVAMRMLVSFPKIDVKLMVGIGGGIPWVDSYDIRLGDVVISSSEGLFGGVVSWDRGKLTGEGLEPRGHFDRPAPVLLSAVMSMKSDRRLPLQTDRLDHFVDAAFPRMPDKQTLNFYQRPESGTDVLHCRLAPDADPDNVCTVCKTIGGHRLIHREPRETSVPKLHTGLIASGSSVLKDAMTRDQMASAWQNKYNVSLLCVEMEAAGLMNEFSCLVIRGISDYCDAYKRDIWKGYAALAAAACAKELLCKILPMKADHGMCPGPSSMSRRPRLTVLVSMPSAPVAAQEGPFHMPTRPPTYQSEPPSPTPRHVPLATSPSRVQPTPPLVPLATSSSSAQPTPPLATSTSPVPQPPPQSTSPAPLRCYYCPTLLTWEQWVIWCMRHNTLMCMSCAKHKTGQLRCASSWHLTLMTQGARPARTKPSIGSLFEYAKDSFLGISCKDCDGYHVPLGTVADGAERIGHRSCSMRKGRSNPMTTWKIWGTQKDVRKTFAVG